LRLANSLFTAFIWRGTSPPPAGNTFAGVIAREQEGLRPEHTEFRQLAHFSLLNLHENKYYDVLIINLTPSPMDILLIKIIFSNEQFLILNFSIN
jgi:hypothetical protein